MSKKRKYFEFITEEEKKSVDSFFEKNDVMGLKDFAEILKVDQKDLRRIVNVLIATVIDMPANKELRVHGLLTFKKSSVKKGEKVDPRDGTPIMIPKHDKLTVSLSQRLRRKITGRA